MYVLYEGLWSGCLCAVNARACLKKLFGADLYCLWYKIFVTFSNSGKTISLKFCTTIKSCYTAYGILIQ